MRHRRDEAGASAVEYALIVVLMVAVSIPAIRLLQAAVGAEYSSTCRAVATYDGDTCG